MRHFGAKVFEEMCVASTFNTLGKPPTVVILTCMTLMSHGMMGSSLSADLISRMARQLQLTKKQFLDLIDCTLDEEGYRAILQSVDNQEEK